MARELKLMADYAVWPLWDADGNVDPATLPISTELQARLDAWAEIFDGTVNRDDPRTALWSSAEAAKEWNEQGVELWHELQHELGTAYVVCYFSEADRDVLFPREEDKARSLFKGPHDH
ncbi:MAG: hypothetical protein JOZ75_12915 [Candidatus Dormibacteraeota bacterium]|nr:hypothetical protein [Candidatus Dormibacteraeota bacterium]